MHRLKPLAVVLIWRQNWSHLPPHWFFVGSCNKAPSLPWNSIQTKILEGKFAEFWHKNSWKQTVCWGCIFLTSDYGICAGWSRLLWFWFDVKIDLIYLHIDFLLTMTSFYRVWCQHFIVLWCILRHYGINYFSNP